VVMVLLLGLKSLGGGGEDGGEIRFVGYGNSAGGERTAMENAV